MGTVDLDSPTRYLKNQTIGADQFKAVRRDKEAEWHADKPNAP